MIEQFCLHFPLPQGVRVPAYLNILEKELWREAADWCRRQRLRTEARPAVLQGA